MAKERVIKASFKTYNIHTFKGIMEKKGKGYTTGVPIFSKENDALLLAQGQSVNPNRYEQMESDLRRAMLKGKSSPYYTTQRTDYTSN